MKKTNVSTCANPECEKKFKRPGEGKLFVQPTGKRRAEWRQKRFGYVPACAKRFDLRYDRRQHEYHLVRRRRVA